MVSALYLWVDRVADRLRKKKTNFAGFTETNLWKKWHISREIHRNFQGKFCWKTIGKNGQFRGSFLGKFRWKAIGFALIWRTLVAKDSNFAFFGGGKWRALAYATTTATETQTTYKCCFCKPCHFARKFEQLVWTIVHVCICLTTRFFSTEIIICSFNNNVLKKCISGKAIYIMATVSGQFFTTLI